jgi:predicted exporter
VPRIRIVLSVLSFAVLASLAVFALSRASNDLTAMLPGGDGTLAREAAFFSTQAATRILVLEADAGPDRQDAARAFLAAAVPGLAPVGATLPTEGTPEGIARAAGVVLDRLPDLLTPEDLAAAAGNLDPAALAARMTALRERASQPDDVLTGGVARQDILALSGSVLGHLRAGPGGSRREGDAFVHGDGRHVLMILDVGFAPDDLDRSEPLIDAVAGIVRAGAAAGVTVAVIGPYRHYVENVRTVRSDLWTTLPLELALVAILLTSLLGSLRVVLAVHVPAIAGVAGSLAGAGVWIACTGNVLPMPLLGFAAGVLGIAVDYATHIAAAARRGERPIRPLITTFCTMAAAFAVLMTAGSPALQCLSVMVIGGLGAALAATIVILPMLLPDLRGPDRWSRLSRPVMAWIDATPRRHLLTAVALSAILLPGLLRIEFESDLKRFDGSSRAAWSELDAFMSRWGPPDSSTFVVATDRDRGTALAAAAEARRRLGLPPSQVERLVPDATDRAARRAAWNAFWRQHGDAGERITTAAAGAGLRAAAFQPSIERYRPVDDADRGPIDWSGTPVESILGMLVIRREDGLWTVASPVLGADRHGAEDLTRRLDAAGPGIAWIANRGDLGGRIVSTVKSELLGRGGFMIGAMILLVLILERSVTRSIAILLPPLLAIAWTFGLLGWIGMPLTPFALLATAFVAGIGIDSAVFLAHEKGHAALSPVLNASFTTIAGFTCMAIADHPVILSMGVTLAVGMTAALITSLLITPALTRRPAGTGH